MRITLTQRGRVLFCGTVTDLSPLGFTVALPIAQVDDFRDDGGRFVRFDIELQLSAADGDYVTGEATVKSVHRVSQQNCGMDVRFIDLNQGAYRQIAEYLSAAAGEAQTASQMVG